MKTGPVLILVGKTRWLRRFGTGSAALSASGVLSLGPKGGQ
jgi:hypothetical protein